MAMGLGRMTPLTVFMLPLTLLFAAFWAMALNRPYLRMVREINSDLRGDYED